MIHLQNVLASFAAWLHTLPPSNLHSNEYGANVDNHHHGKPMERVAYLSRTMTHTCLVLYLYRTVPVSYCVAYLSRTGTCLNLLGHLHSNQCLSPPCGHPSSRPSSFQCLQ